MAHSATLDYDKFTISITDCAICNICQYYDLDKEGFLVEDGGISCQIFNANKNGKRVQFQKLLLINEQDILADINAAIDSRYEILK